MGPNVELKVIRKKQEDQNLYENFTKLYENLCLSEIEGPEETVYAKGICLDILNLPPKVVGKSIFLNLPY